MITIVIAEDQGMLRGALGSLLDLEADLHVIGQAGNGQEALHLLQTLQPNVCLLDIEMPLMTGLDVAEKVQEQQLATKVIIVTTFARPGYFERAIKAGVHGYLLKDGSSDALAQCIRQVVSGKREYAPELIVGAIGAGNPLSMREQNVLRLVADGYTAKEIAHTLFLSSGTVRNYISEIYQKLHAKNKMDAIIIAKEKGWI
ncbi:DNA-binding response regulator [Fictibacillus macauensis ZFHKF-1]|uniref:DNA-binding response regulator n=1 Tax=Fictibacillus macauensis ZFHKF-1 TaxID=1196324 RepID=I8J3R0_9BACL|nr:response regulator transcription factor [Fictibacillus macauensis]EIT86406.1 DNA-binding response regulator [Fictibacillus macauensis ZFHKF-1]